MGGEFFMEVVDRQAFTAIDSVAWRQAMEAIPTRFPAPRFRSTCSVSFGTADVPSFEFREADGSPKSFRLPAVLDHRTLDGGIVNNLSGRHRTPGAYRYVADVIMHVCDQFPGVFRLVVCDTLSGGGNGADFENADWCYDGRDRCPKQLVFSKQGWLTGEPLIGDPL